MKIYWTLASIPELKSLKPVQRRIAYYACRRSTYQHWQTWAGSIFAALIGLAIGGSLLMLILKSSPFSPIATYFTAGFGGGVIVVGITEYLRSIVINSTIGPHLAQHLAEENDPEE